MATPLNKRAKRAEEARNDWKAKAIERREENQQLKQELKIKSLEFDKLAESFKLLREEFDKVNEKSEELEERLKKKK